MTQRTHRMFVEDILEAMGRIQSYIKGVDYQAFVQNQMRVDAGIRNLEIIGEASRNIPETLRKEFVEIPRRRMIGLRNLTIHEYFGIDLSIIWQIITQNLPETKPQLEATQKRMNKKE